MLPRQRHTHIAHAHGKSGGGEKAEQAVALLPAELLIGWSILCLSTGKCIGHVEDVTHTGEPQLSPEMLKVVNQTPEGVQSMVERHLIPYVPEIVKKIDADTKQAYIQPPKGLLQLGRKQLLLDIIYPRILEIAASSSDSVEGHHDLAMPTRACLEKLGEHKLVRRILLAGGFLYVAQQLCLRVSRRPNGYWENLDNLDEELSLFVADHWAEFRDEDDNVYFYNSILGRTQWIEPEVPLKIPLDDEGTMIIAEDENDRVMPSFADLHASRRFGLIAAIRFHGGYRQVAEDLDRTPKRQFRSFAGREDDLVREIKSAQSQICGEGPVWQMPTRTQLYAAGRPELVHAIAASGGFHRVAEKAKLSVHHRPTHYWRDPQVVIAALNEYYSSPKCITEPGYMPSSRELLMAGRGDLRYGLSLHGSKKIAAMIGLKVRNAGRKKIDYSQKDDMFPKPSACTS